MLNVYTCAVYTDVNYYDLCVLCGCRLNMKTNANEKIFLFIKALVASPTDAEGKKNTSLSSNGCLNPELCE